MNKMAAASVVFLFLVSSLMEITQPAETEFMNTSSTSCPQRDMQRCESKCNISCSPLDKRQEMDNETMSSTKHHFVLVHGLGQGAWNWDKVKTLLMSFGHQVTAFDLAASGAKRENIAEVNTFLEYSKPLLDFMATVPSGQKVFLIGHSLGGMNIAYAMDRFPDKVAAGVFLTAFMPDTTHPPSYVVAKFIELALAEHLISDTQISFDGNKETILFGPIDLYYKLLDQAPPKERTLAISLQRVGSLFIEDLSTAPNFSEEGYGSVSRVYIISGQDKLIKPEFQRWMIQNYPVEKVKKIEDSDHLPLISRPQKTCRALLDIAEMYN